MSIILNTDSYKTSHFLQYPPNTTRVSSYIESRGGDFDEIVTFGLQAFIKAHLLTPITRLDIDEAAAICAAHGVPFNREGWERILNKHGGYLPLEIEGLPEGSIVEPGTMQVQVVNTDPELPWLTSYIETALLRAIWYPSTVASLSRRAKQFINQALIMTADDPAAEIGFKLHDFGARGATSEESAVLGGMAHLVNFLGTDTLSGVVGARRYYNADMAGFSIPASEHSTMTSWGREGEVDAYRNMLLANPTGLVACVSDSYDIFNAVSNIWGDKLKPLIERRDGTLVVRPDSGDPTLMPVQVIERLMDKFGYETNTKGYKVLPPYIRVIQGDGMNIDTIPRLLTNLADRGISASNIAMGMGGGLLQKVDRDTCKYAMKANAAEVDGEWRDVFKDPITDQGKKSKAGILAVVRDADRNAFRTMRKADVFRHLDPRCNRMQKVYRNGELLVDDTFDAIRERAAV